jgi:hypothetical protein
MAATPGPDDFIDAIGVMFRPSLRPWVLFRNGTVIGPLGPDEDLSVSATDLLRRIGPVRPGGPGGDFRVFRNRDAGWPGWLVAYDHHKMATVVLWKEFEAAEPSHLQIGLFGRNKRALDADMPEVVHVMRGDDA